MNVQKTKYLIASIVMALAVALGAFGAHGLKPYLTEYGTGIFKTANFYHFIHGIALFIVLYSVKSTKMLNWIFYGFLAGILLFSGSLYLLALKDVLGFVQPWFGAITPLGGLMFIISWLAIGLNIFLKKN